jgi:hypothetical protein
LTGPAELKSREKPDGQADENAIFSLFFVVAGALFTPLVTTAAGLSSDYLTGNWTLESSENCGKPEFESISFKNDGSVSASRFGNTTLTGFCQFGAETDRALEKRLLTKQRRLEIRG